jgi:hypothetical protein
MPGLLQISTHLGSVPFSPGDRLLRARAATSTRDQAAGEPLSSLSRQVRLPCLEPDRFLKQRGMGTGTGILGREGGGNRDQTEGGDQGSCRRPKRETN